MVVQSDAPDISLFHSIARGDEHAFKLLFNRYRGKVYASAYKWTQSHLAAEEMTQEVFLKIWEKRHLLADVTDPAKYIYRIIYNQTRDYFRSSLTRQRLLQQVEERQTGYTGGADEMLNARESEQLLQQALQCLSPQKRAIYMMARQQGKSHQEIAGIMDISVHTVKSHLYDSIQFIRAFFRNAWLFFLFIVSDFVK